MADVPCLCCQAPVPAGEGYHPKCLRALFGKARAPVIPFGLADIPAQVVNTGARMSISGAQMKLSVRLNPENGTLETVAEGGRYILKPEPAQFAELQFNENLCMNIASWFGMAVPPHGLFKMSDGNFCYIIKRFDRMDDGTRLPKETMFQIMGARDKYRGSLEQIGKVVRAHAANVGLDTIDFFERALLSFLIGNGDMHLKNWALLTLPSGIGLSPCYDFVSSKVYLPDETDFAVAINGKHTQLTRRDFETLAGSLKIDLKPMEHSIQKFLNGKEKVLFLCRTSRVSPELRDKLMGVIESRYQRIYV